MFKCDICAKETHDNDKQTLIKYKSKDDYKKIESCTKCMESYQRLMLHKVIRTGRLSLQDQIMMIDSLIKNNQ